MRPQNSEKLPAESKRFIDLARKLVHVPKKDVDKQIEKERQAKQQAKEEKRKV